MIDSTPTEPADILLVEDNPGDVRLTKEAFRSIDRDVEFEVFTSGKSAVDFAKQYLSADAESRPDLILLDLNLPRVDGFDVLTVLNEELDAPPPPVLVLSSSSASQDIQQSYRKGCHAYLTKPDDMDEFTSMAASIKDFWLDTAKPPKVPT